MHLDGLAPSYWFKSGPRNRRKTLPFTVVVSVAVVVTRSARVSVFCLLGLFLSPRFCLQFWLLWSPRRRKSSYSVGRRKPRRSRNSAWVSRGDILFGLDHPRCHPVAWQGRQVRRQAVHGLLAEMTLWWLVNGHSSTTSTIRFLSPSVLPGSLQV